MFIQPLILASGLVTLALAGDATSQCPDKKATQVPVENTTSGATHTCGIGLVIFGVGGGIFGEDCPETKVMTPAHQTCQNEGNEGTACVPGDDMQVTTRSCSCGGLVLPYVEVGIPTTCECDPPVNSGTVEDFKTVVCASTRGYQGVP